MSEVAPLRIALPNKGRMAPAVHKLFGDAGMHLDDVDAESALLSRVNERYEAMFVRAKDIPAFVADGVADVVAVGRALIANPDLVERWQGGHPENELVQATVYTPGAEGYTDYPFLTARG